MSALWRSPIRLFLLIVSLVSFGFVAFIWINLDLDLSAAYFSGDDLTHVRFVWREINYMLGALLVFGLCVIALLTMARE